jgi:hypothetical protein
MVGEVVGITSSALVGGENLNFAVPINDVKPLLAAKLSRTSAFPDEPERQAVSPAPEQDAPKPSAKQDCFIFASGTGIGVNRQEALNSAQSEIQSHLAYKCGDGWMSNFTTVIVDCRPGYNGSGYTDAWSCISEVTAQCHRGECR